MSIGDARNHHRTSAQEASVEFEGFESDADETISVDEAKEQEKEAEELRD